MAVASWMLRNRNLRMSRFNQRLRFERDEDFVKVDLKRDPQENITEFLTEICKRSGLTEGKHVNYLNGFIKVFLSIEGNLSRTGYSVEEILCCLRVPLINDYSLVRGAALKAIRHVLTSEEDVECFNKLNFPFLVARSLDSHTKNDLERIQAISLMRKVILLSASAFEIAMVRSLVSLANCGIDDKDRMLRASVACLAELGVLNPELFIICGGVTALTRNLSECQTPRIAESLCGVLLLLLDRPITRNHAAVDLRCVASPYCEFQYRYGWMDKNKEEREHRFNGSRLALLSILRSWPGILHFCSPSNISGLKSIVDVLYLNQLEVRKAVLDLLYELLGLPQPEWTDELSVALAAIDPAEPQFHWKLNEGFVAAEGRYILPNLVRTSPSIADIHLALLLYCFLETGLLSALTEVIGTSDTFISVRATVLLGELCRLIQILLPSECFDVTPALPTLLANATTKPQALAAVTALQQLHKVMKKRPASASLYLDYILQSGSFMKRSRNDPNKRYKTTQPRFKLYQLVLKEGEDIIRNTGVLISKDALTWNWGIIMMILKDESDFTLDLCESSHLAFLKQLVEFFIPTKNRYSHMDLTTSKNAKGYTLAGIELISCLMRLDHSDSTKLLIELFTDIANQIASITTTKTAHDCLFSPQHMSNTQCQTYFLFIGRLSTTKAGLDVLNSIKIFELLYDLIVTTKHDCYAKVIVSSLDYTDPGPGRDVLTSALQCSVESARVYATQFLHVLLRAGIPQFSIWGVKLLSDQLKDKCRTVYLTAINVLQEACEVQSCLEQLVKLEPNLLHLGEKGLLLLIRFLSIPAGFNMLKKNNFVVNEIRRWDDYLNMRYVRIVEGQIADSLTLHKRGEDGRYDKRLSSLKVRGCKDIFLPPHIYGQLAKHSEGFHVLLEHGSVDKYIQCLENGLCETEDDILILKAAIWTLGHLGSSIKGCELLNNKGILACLIRIASHCVVYSVRATAFFSLSLVATTRLGADSLYKLGWICTRHDRHDRWPILEEETWDEELSEEQMYTAPTVGSDSEHTSSDHAFIGDYFLNIPDADSTTTDEDLPYGNNARVLTTHQKSSTLPCNQNPLSVHHKRSLSESKTFDVLKVQERKPNDRVDFKINTDAPHRYRDNSVTESTTSGVSSCESALGKTYQNDKVHTLSPIPSSSSLMTLKTSGVRMRRHSESSRRVSLQSMTPSDRTSSPVGSICGKISYRDRVGYAMVQLLRVSRLNQYNLFAEDEQAHLFDPETIMNTSQTMQGMSIERQNSLNHDDFRSDSFRRNYLDNMSLTSLTSVEKFSIKDDVSRNKGQCYMGICLPQALTDLFPDYQVISRRLSFAGKNLTLDDNVSQTENEMNTYDFKKLRERRKNRFIPHNIKYCMSCSRMRFGKLINLSHKHLSQTNENEQTNKNSYPFNVFTENSALKCEILEKMERLSNPIWIKQIKQTIIHYKEEFPELFNDICFYSEVCKVLAENSFRLGPRRFLQDLFPEVDYEEFYTESCYILKETRQTSVRNPPAPNRTVNNSGSDRMSCISLMTEQRKAELLNTNKTMVVVAETNKNTVCGFNLNKTSVNEDECLSPIHIELRSPTLSSVKEENCTSIENSSSDCCTTGKRNTIGGETEHTKTSLPTIKTLDSLNLSYSQNKFPIRSRSKSDPKSVIK